MFRALIQTSVIAAMLWRPSYAPEEPKEFSDATLTRNLTRIKAAVARADLIFVGVVEKVGVAPKFKSGGYVAYQPVTYKVAEVLRGELPGGATSHVTVHHMVVGGSRNANPKPDTNELSPGIFRPGRRLIVMARRERIDGLTWVDVDEDFGTLEATEQNLQAMRALVHAK